MEFDRWLYERERTATERIEELKTSNDIEGIAYWRGYANAFQDVRLFRDIQKSFFRKSRK